MPGRYNYVDMQFQDKTSQYEYSKISITSVTISPIKTTLDDQTDTILTFRGLPTILPLHSAGQHSLRVMLIVWRLRGNIIRTVLCCIL